MKRYEELLIALLLMVLIGRRLNILKLWFFEGSCGEGLSKTDGDPLRRLVVGLIAMKINLLLMSNPPKVLLMRH
ncbi:hypothetical protein BN874_1680048 [Candidatus Contendobacter odensis Run_B_J11]|uniref:Uncharacterized protein n=1 Tax=Candidatus Contendobacter odensis Run_B_J11 TaxID=1400861 RepID=A0A7U7J2S5_9GAMM|nr:hypothetical protein BN874_1680048 [Candidatus Contendobacter odensis Run_B_J11]